MTCEACNGYGITSGRHWLEMAVAILLEAGETAIYPNPPHGVWSRKVLREEEGRYPTKDLGELTTALAGSEPDDMIGYDALDTKEATEKIIRAAGLDPATWGICQACQGKGEREGA